MKGMLNLLAGLAISALVAAGGAPHSAVAQDKAKDTKAAPAAKAEKGAGTTKVIVDNERVRAQEVTYKPGDENTSVPRDGRVIRALTSGTLQRTYPDGKTMKIEWKAGDVRYNEPIFGDTPQYTTKNTGKSTLVLYVVILKGTSQAAPAKK